VALLAYLDRDGYVDADGSAISPLDALYYASVSVTTTGYGDIRPESDSARLLTTLLVTPARILFLIVLVGTTIEVLAERSRRDYLVGRWRKRLRDHVIVCGYGTKGRAAVRTLLARGTDRERIVVVDPDPEARAVAAAHGLAAVAGSATDSGALREAKVEEAVSVVVAPNDDAAAVLMTLTAREHNPDATIVAACREEENVHLLRQSGATSVIVTSGSAGRLLGLATQAPRLVEVLEDLMSVGQGLDIMEREVEVHECGPLPDLNDVNPIVAVIRGEQLLRFDDPRAATLRPGDRIVYLCNREDRRSSSP
jgi:voltage-gated potassium channel